MIFLMFMGGIFLWLTTAIMLSKRIPRWLGVAKHRGNLSVLLFPLVLVSPFADELIGRWQFNRLCEREAVVTLSPDADKVTRARRDDDLTTEIAGYAMRILVQKASYVDIDTGAGLGVTGGAVAANEGAFACAA